ncbi:MAG TPA: glycerol-3-phosphate acyltransferase [Candidatus Limnocylindrales bacterium]|nr:glycerol-3-phosphate acyltransferase [Candidatus Limnocylindrales bacterium]
MDPVLALVAAAAGYLLGSISFARVVARLVDRTVDVTFIVTEVGDGVTFTSDAVSATSVRMKLGKRYGLLVAFLDMAKVAIPVLVLRLLYPGEPYLYLAAAAGVAGHNWPVYHRFKGGRGESAIMGALLVIDPIGLVLMLTLGMVIGFLAGNILVLEWTGFILMVPWLWLTTGDPAAVAFMASVLAMWAIAMLPELRQYAAMISLPNAPTNEQVVQEYGMSAKLGRAMDNYSIPALVKRLRSTAG